MLSRRQLILAAGAGLAVPAVRSQTFPAGHRMRSRGCWPSSFSFI